MPELPEVEVVRAGLERQVIGSRVIGVEVFHQRTLRGETPQTLIAATVGKTLQAVVRRGKFMWWLFSAGNVTADVDGGVRNVGTTGDAPQNVRITGDAPKKTKFLNAGGDDAVASRKSATDGFAAAGSATGSQSSQATSVPTPTAILVHLGMSGQVLVNTKNSGPVGQGALKHLRVRFALEDGRFIDFVDQRTFGRLHPVELVATDDGAPGGLGASAAVWPKDLIGKLARDCLDSQVDWVAVAKKVRARQAPIKNLLLDQSIVSGIGNIYADEALYAAKVHPQTPGRRLSVAKVQQLYQSAKDVMERALEQGGTSFDALYVDPDGNPGYFARSLQVYGRQGAGCPRCARVLRQIRIAGRSATYCPGCQKRH